jgi:hypothetical protein
MFVVVCANCACIVCCVKKGRVTFGSATIFRWPGRRPICRESRITGDLREVGHLAQEIASQGVGAKGINDRHAPALSEARQTVSWLDTNRCVKIAKARKLRIFIIACLR